MNKYFVWIQGLRGPTAQLWDEKDKTWEGKPIKTLANPIKLHAKDDRDLNQLMLDYPFEAKE